jgi:hypothetical protein
MTDNYDDMTRDQLLEHCRSYKNAIHDLANKVMSLQGRLRKEMIICCCVECSGQEREYGKR